MLANRSSLLRRLHPFNLRQNGKKPKKLLPHKEFYMNRFNLDPVFTLNVRRIDSGYVSNLVTLEVDTKIERELVNMTEYKDAQEILSKFVQNKN
jgi:hypothetical protein